MEQPVYSVTDFVAVCNQVLDMAMGSVVITGELSNFKVSKGKWLYFDLKDEYSSVRFFGTVYQLQTPVEDGMILTVRGNPQLHPRFGFSVNVQTIQLSGEGTIKKAAQLLEENLRKEGLFDEDRKRSLPYPPQKIGLITSGESAAYADFIKILASRWGGVEIFHYDVQVQGEQAPAQIVRAIDYFNSHANEPDVLVVVRGGGSADDLQAFSTESVTRSVAGSRIPVLVAIGHEVDISLAELAADKRASTPSNAAELLVPDKRNQIDLLQKIHSDLGVGLLGLIAQTKEGLERNVQSISRNIISNLDQARQQILLTHRALEIMHPERVLERGYAIVRQNKMVVSSKDALRADMALEIQFQDGTVIVNKQDTV